MRHEELTDTAQPLADDERPQGLAALTFDTRGPVEPMADINYSFDQMELTRRVMALTAEQVALLEMIRVQNDTIGKQNETIGELFALIRQKVAA